MMLSRLILIVIITIITVVIGDEDVVTNYVKCSTTKGDIVLEIYRDWSPRGADRFMDLVNDGFFTNIALYRCVDRFLTQFGISDNPAMKHWHNDEILDDHNLHKGIKRGYLSFAGGGKNTRSSQLFIAFEDLDFLGKEPWETPFGKVIEGDDVLDKFYKGYGDIPPFGHGPDQQKLHNRGNSYIKNEFPLIDFIEQCEIVEKKVQYMTGGEVNEEQTENTAMEPRIQPDEEEESEELEEDRRIQEEDREHMKEFHNREKEEEEDDDEEENGEENEEEEDDEEEESESVDDPNTEEESESVDDPNTEENSEGVDDPNTEEESEGVDDPNTEEKSELYIHKRPKVLKKHNRNEESASFLDRQNYVRSSTHTYNMLGSAMLFLGLAAFFLAQYTGKSKNDPFDRNSKRNI